MDEQQAIRQAVRITVNEMVQKIMEDMDEIRESIPDQNYLDICQKLQTLHQSNSARHLSPVSDSNSDTERDREYYCSCTLV